MPDIPKYPVNFLPFPIAKAGDRSVVPENPPAQNLVASFLEGFPAATSRPTKDGGVAPKRSDFNAMFNILSGLLFWLQSGGQMKWSDSMNYTTPSIVYHGDTLWFCQAENGPGSASGIQEPSEDNPDYWITLAEKLGIKGGGGSNPVGTIIMYHGTTAPEGYLICNGASFSATTYPQLRAILGKTTLPDMRGLFPRGYDPTSARDPDGASRGVGSMQDDAQQRIRGTFATGMHFSYGSIGCSGPFIGNTTQNFGHPETSSRFNGGQRIFDSSRAVRTSTEDRPKNIALLFCIKHD